MSEGREPVQSDTSELRDALSELRAGLRGTLERGQDETSAKRGDAPRGEGRKATERVEARREAGRVFSLYEELRTQLAGVAASQRSGEVDDFGLDLDALSRAQRLLDFLFDRYWRVAVSGLEHLPVDGPCLFVSNRSGILPYDGLMLAQAFQRARPEWPRVRFLVADWLITLPFAQPTLARLGGVRACPENAERLLRSGRSVIAFPEGVKGAAKVFRDRYRLKRFGRGGAIRSALRTGVPLVPIAVVGAEEAHPILFKSDWLATRTLGLPFLPVTPTFPLLGPLGLLPLPTRWRISIGPPMTLPDLEGLPEDELEISRLNERLRARVQELLDAALAERESVWS